MKEAEKRQLKRKLRDGYIKEAVEKIVDKLKGSGEDASIISEMLYGLGDSVKFTIVQQKKIILHVLYCNILDFASEMDINYELDEAETARLLLAPIFPSVDFSDDELALLEFVEFEYDEEPVKINTLIKDAAGDDKVKNAKKSLHSLQEKGLFTTKNGNVILKHDFPSSITPYGDGNEDEEWYVDDDFNLTYGKAPKIGTHDDLVNALMEAEKEYRAKWWAKIEKENERLEAIFADDLKDLKEATRGYYLNDIWWFLFSYFFYETIPSIHKAAGNILDFFRYYICRATGHSEYLVKRMASTIKRFYAVMYREGEVSEKEYNRVVADIKDNISWLIETAVDYEARLEYFH